MSLLLLSEPSAAPQNFAARFNATSYDSIFLSWDPLPPEDQNGIILGYLINITDISREDTLQFSSDTHNLSIESLRPHTTYTCLVAAYTSIGMGPFSTEISVQTLETSKCVHVLETVICNLTYTATQVQVVPPPTLLG